MRTIPSALQTALDDGVFKPAVLLEIVPQVGSTIRVSSHYSPITFDGNEYTGLTDGIDAFDVTDTPDGSVARSEVALARAALTTAQIFGQNLDGATFTYTLVHRPDPDNTSLTLRKGFLGDLTRTDVVHEVELRSISQKLQTPIGEQTSPTDRARLGDDRNGLSKGSHTTGGTVTAVTDRRTFTDSSFAQADDFYNYGEISWLTGNNAGFKSLIKDFGSGQFELYDATGYDIQVGDTFNAVSGYDGTLDQAFTKFNNVENFRGEPFVPNSSLLVQRAPQKGSQKQPK